MDDLPLLRQEWWTSGEEPGARITVLETEDGDRLGRCPTNPERWMWLVLHGATLPADCDDRCSEWRDFRYFEDPLFLPTEGINRVSSGNPVLCDAAGEITPAGRVYVENLGTSAAGPNRYRQPSINEDLGRWAGLLSDEELTTGRTLRSHLCIEACVCPDHRTPLLTCESLDEAMQCLDKGG